jgi:copper chaperone CopZ
MKFKTNVKCGGCVAAIRPEMDKLGTTWSVDLNHPDRIMTVEGNITEEAVRSAMKTAGYQAEKVGEG